MKNAPPRIRTDTSNTFAHHTMAVRVPAIIQRTLESSATAFTPEVQAGLAQLARDMSANSPLPGVDASAPYAEEWQGELEVRAGARWLETDWFFAENYAYRLIAELTGHFRHGTDVFRPLKLAEYQSPAHAAALSEALGVEGPRVDALECLLEACVFGNRMDSSYAPSHQRGTQRRRSDLLLDERRAAAKLLVHGAGAVHFVLDNVGTELALDLVLAARIIDWLGAPVILHVKVHPAFISDAIVADVREYLESPGAGSSDLAASGYWQRLPQAARGWREQLADALADGRLQARAHPFWSGPRSLWDLPADLARQFSGARLVLLKGDAHYRRAVGDALWPAETRFADVTREFPAPLLALRTLKSDPLVGVARAELEELARTAPQFRVDGQRGVACLGGQLAP